jgi:hypothetical protein
MEKFKSIDEVLDFAMKSEQEAVDFYTSLASQMHNQEMKETFLQFAKKRLDIKHVSRKLKMKGYLIFQMKKYLILKSQIM